MSCKCVNIDFGSEENYNQTITVEIPPHMESYKRARLAVGLSSKISIDPCIYPEIVELWSKGIITYGSCCGHNKIESFVNIADENIQDMLDMGYVQNHWDENRKDTFKLKTS